MWFLRKSSPWLSCPWFLFKLQTFHLDCWLQQWRQLLSIAKIQEINSRYDFGKLITNNCEHTIFYATVIFPTFYFFHKMRLEIWRCSLSMSGPYTWVFIVIKRTKNHFVVTFPSLHSLKLAVEIPGSTTTNPAIFSPHFDTWGTNIIANENLPLFRTGLLTQLIHI